MRSKAVSSSLAITLVVLAGLIPAAHALRWQGLPAALAWLVPLVFLPFGREFVRRAGQATLMAGMLATWYTGLGLVRLRLGLGEPWTRLAVIMTLAGLICGLGALALDHPLFSRDRGRPSRGWPGLAAWALCLTALLIVQFKVHPAMLLAERFLPGAGLLQASLMAVYAGFIAEALLAPGRSPVVRRRIWSIFSLAFFSQLALGLAGFKTFLMTGYLHPPVPALIVAGPLFRGQGMLMLVLFTITVLLAGPAWCSHLCYIGALDSAMAGQRPPKPVKAWLAWARAALAGLVFASAWLLGRSGLPLLSAAWLGMIFGLIGVGVMVFASRRAGIMTHCLGYCPMGLLAALLGRLSPWRMTMGQGCTACGACAKACRYGALEPRHLALGRPGYSCSLCGDCLERCPGRELGLKFFIWQGPWVRPAFAALVAGLHALFLGVAMI